MPLNFLGKCKLGVSGRRSTSEDQSGSSVDSLVVPLWVPNPFSSSVSEFEVEHCHQQVAICDNRGQLRGRSTAVRKVVDGKGL